MSTDDNYAPKSPDLSSLFAAGPTAPAPQQLQLSSQSDYKAPPPNYGRPSSSSYAPPTSSALHNHEHNHSHNQAQIHAPVQVQPPHYLAQPPPPSHPVAVKSEYQSYSPPGHHPYLPQSPSQGISPQDPYGVAQHPAFQAPQPQQQQQHHHLLYSQPPPDHNSPAYGQHPYAPNLGAAAVPPHHAVSADMPPRKAAAPAAPVIEPSPVKTKFPTARIKRIMQADEEVGKVAQQTPIAVGKALELFMIHLVSKSADVAREKGSKRVTAPMLKHVVETDEQWDFLRDIVGRVENEKEGKAKAKAESSSDEEIPEPKKRGRGGRKKKAA